MSHNKIIHKDFVCIEGSGEIFYREEYMKNWATDFSNGGFTHFVYKDEVIRILVNSASVRSKTVYTRIVAGKPSKEPLSIQTRMLRKVGNGDVYRRRVRLLGIDANIGY